MTLSGNIVNANRARKVRALHKVSDIRDMLTERIDEGERPRLSRKLSGPEIARLWDAERLNPMSDLPTSDLGQLIAFRVNDPGADDHGSIVPLADVTIRAPAAGKESRRTLARVKRQLDGMRPVFAVHAVHALLRAYGCR